MGKNRKKEDGIFYDFATGRCWEHNGKSKRLLWTENMLRELKAKFPHHAQRGTGGHATDV